MNGPFQSMNGPFDNMQCMLVPVLENNNGF